jgi:hypothetical protein
MTTTVFSHQSAVLEEASLRDVYQSILPEIEAFPSDQLQLINIDIPSAVATLLGALPRLREQREVLGQLVGFDVARFDKLEVYARALTYAHRLFLIASQPPDDLKALHEEAVQLREVLFRDASAAVARGWIPALAIDDLRGTVGYKNTAHDLGILVGVLQENWAKVAGKCGTTEQELAYADKLMFHILRVFGVRENGPEGMAEVTEMRLRAYALFVLAYDDVRQAILFLRRQSGDADRIAPTLYGPRAPRSKKEEASAPPAEGSEAASESPPNAGATSSPSGAATVATSPSSEASASKPNLGSPNQGPFAG